MQAYQAKIATKRDAPLQIDPAYASPAERKQYSEAEEFSFFHFFAGHVPKSKGDLASLPLGPVTTVDLPATLGANFNVPVYIVQGSADLTTAPEVAKAYFDRIKAPRKGFYLVPGNGHEPSEAMLQLTHKVLVEEVKPLAK